ncbi:uncharacterized protein LOC143288965 [Babylonia areolata]|uniref:uncharacterized protein LOC143288965 n=1 Tax=Babylonia areolata TaxID=304850 RepID=UPI003FD09CEA
MDTLDSCLDMSKWQKLDTAQKKDFQEYQVMRQHKKMTDTSFQYIIQPEGDDHKKVVIQFTVKDKDPLKNIGTVELRLKEDIVTGIDLDGDCFELIEN